MKNKIHFIYAALFIAIIGGCLLLLTFNYNGKSGFNTPKLEKELCDEISDKSISSNLESNSSTEHATPGFCDISIGKNLSYKFSFENISKQANPEFVLNIYSSNNNIIQSIPLDYAWSFNNLTINLHDDINADGYKDLLVRVFAPRAAQFTYYIYNPTKKIFEKSDVLSNIFLPTFDAKNMTIKATADIPNYYYDDNGNQQYYTPEEQTTVFKFKDGKYTE